MPWEWFQVLSHYTTKDKAALLLRLKNDMTITDVHDLIEYQNYESWQNHEEEQKNSMKQYNQ